MGSSIESKTANRLRGFDPASVVGGLKVIGFWDASTNTPDLSSLTLEQGQSYQVSVSGSTSLNGESNWRAKDLVVWSDTLAGKYFKLDNTDDVISVNGQTGVVTVQDTLVSGTNIKTINGVSLLGSGDLVLSSKTDLGNVIFISTNGSAVADRVDVVGDILSPVTWDRAKVIANVGDKFVYYPGTYSITSNLLIDGVNGEAMYGAVFNSDQSTANSIFDNTGFASGGHFSGYGYFDRIAGGGSGTAYCVNVSKPYTNFECLGIGSMNAFSSLVIVGAGQNILVHGSITSTGSSAVEGFAGSGIVRANRIYSTAGRGVLHNSNSGNSPLKVIASEIQSTTTFAAQGDMLSIECPKIVGSNYAIQFTGYDCHLSTAYMYGLQVTGAIATTTVTISSGSRIGHVSITNGKVIMNGVFEGDVTQTGGHVIGTYYGAQGFGSNDYMLQGGYGKIDMIDLGGRSKWQQTGGDADVNLTGPTLTSYVGPSFVDGGVCRFHGEVTLGSVPYFIAGNGSGTIDLTDAKVVLTQAVGTGGRNQSGVLANGTTKVIMNGSTIINTVDTSFLPLETTSGTPVAKINAINTNAAGVINNPPTGFTGYAVNINQNANVE